MKRFAYGCIGIFALTLAFHLGVKHADAQSGGQFVSIAVHPSSSPNVADVYALTASGELWRAGCVHGCSSDPFPNWSYWGVIGGPVPAAQTTWGQVKAGAGR